MKYSLTVLCAIFCHGMVQGSLYSNMGMLEMLTNNPLEKLARSLPAGKVNLADSDYFTIEGGITMETFLTEYNYTYESHSVTTEDGYILALDRITGSPYSNSTNSSDTSNKTAVLIMHGLTSSSVDWVLIGPNRSLPLLLADKDYDVWLGNNRGNTWSRKHETLDADSNVTFWNYSFHELGMYDLPAFVDYILNVTNQSQIQYVGHSQGGSQFYVLNSMKPEYNDKFSVSALLAPAGYMGNITHPLVALLKDDFPIIGQLIRLAGLYEIGAHYNFYNILATGICNESYYLPLCPLPVTLAFGQNILQVDPELLPRLLLSYPSSASAKQIFHFAQEVLSGNFSQFDYGPCENLERYGVEQPPSYNLTAITVPTGFFYSGNDFIISDIDTLSEQISNTVKMYKVTDDYFTHSDFLFAKDLYDLLNVYVIELLDSYK